MRSYSSDRGSPDDERRSVNGVVASPDSSRLVVFRVSGGMMDLGWAQRASPDVIGACRAFVDGTSSDLLHDIRAVLDRMEVEQCRFATVQFLALDVEAIGDGTRVKVARCGATRLFVCGPRPARTIGLEDAWPFEPGEHGFDAPVIVTAALRPRHRWNVRSDGGEGFVLMDETEAADAGARACRESVIELADPSDVSLVVVSHPFWTELDGAEMPSASAHAEIASSVERLVGAASHGDAFAVVVPLRA